MAPLLSELLAGVSVVMGAEEALPVGVVTTSTVPTKMTETVELIAALTGFESAACCATGGSTTAQPGAVRLEVHWETVGSTALQPTDVGVEVHCASVGSTAAQPAAVGVEVHWASVGRTALQPAVVGAEVH